MNERQLLCFSIVLLIHEKLLGLKTISVDIVKTVLEFTKQPRYKYEYISKMVANVDVFRVKYYLIVFTLRFYGFYLVGDGWLSNLKQGVLNFTITCYVLNNFWF